MKVSIESHSDIVEPATGSKVEKHVETRNSFVKYDETPTHLLVHMGLPSVDPKALDVSLSGRRLSVSFEKKSEEKTSENGVEKVVKSMESFRKEVDLPLDVDPQSAEATLKAGVLEVKLTKKPLDQQKGERVSVNIKP